MPSDGEGAVADAMAQMGYREVPSDAVAAFPGKRVHVVGNGAQPPRRSHGLY
jgi:hypothetical protein